MAQTLTPQSILEASEARAFLYIADSESLRRERFIAKYLSLFAEPQKREVIRFDGRFFSEKELRGFQSEVRTMSLFSAEKIVVVTHVDSLSAALLSSMSSEFSSLNGVFLLFSGAPQQERSLFRKSFKENYLEFQPLKGPEMKRWLKKECQTQGIETVDDDALQMLAEVCDGSVDAAIKLIDKVSLSLEGSMLSKKLLSQILENNRAISEYEIIDSLLMKDVKRSRQLHTASMKDQISPYGLIPLLGKNLHTMLSLLFAQKEKYSLEKLKTKLGVSPWIINKLSPALKKQNIDSAISLQQRALDTEFRLKSKSLAPIDILDSLLPERE